MIAVVSMTFDPRSLLPAGEMVQARRALRAWVLVGFLVGLAVWRFDWLPSGVRRYLARGTVLVASFAIWRTLAHVGSLSRATLKKMRGALAAGVQGGMEMELRDFVAETLTQIVEGVKAAQGRAKEHGARVSPHLTTSADLAVKHGILVASGSAAQLVQFDVAVTVKEGTATKGGIGVALGVVALGSAGQSQAENASVSRVKFSVPLVLPDAEG